MAGNRKPFNPFKFARKHGMGNIMLNDQTFLDYYYRLQEIAINMFAWENLPDTVDERFLELTLCEYGYAIYFNDEVLGNLALTCTYGTDWDVYRVPMKRRAWAINGYSRELTKEDSVIIWNNRMRQGNIMPILLYARRLYELERTIDVNVKAQKTPVLIKTTEAQKLTLENIYREYDGNKPVIFAQKGLDLEGIEVLSTNAPFVADKLEILKRQIWNEALTFFGVENTNAEKKERLLTDEILSNLGGVQAQRYVMLNSRREAADKINKMFGTNIEVNFRQDFSALNVDMPTTTTTTNKTTSELVEKKVDVGGHGFLG